MWKYTLAICELKLKALVHCLDRNKMWVKQCVTNVHIPLFVLEFKVIHFSYSQHWTLHLLVFIKRRH